MVAIRARRFLVVIVASLAVGALSAPSFGADADVKGTTTEKSPQKSDPQADKERLIESRKAQQEKRGELRDAVKSGASKDDIKQLQKNVKEGQKAIVQDKKDIRKDRLGTGKDETKPSGEPAKDAK
jgi:hypothetical protein